MKIRELSSNGVTVPLSNLVIIVGPNGSGKTTFLTELQYQYIHSTPTSSVSNGSQNWQNLLSGNFLDTTEAEWRKWNNDLKKITDAPMMNGSNGSYSIVGNLSHETKGNWFDDTDKHNLENAFTRPISLDDLHIRFGVAFKSQQAYHGTIENRLWISGNGSGSINYRYSSQLKVAPYLAINKSVLTTLNRSMRTLFNKQFFVESNNYPSYVLDIGPAGLKGAKKGSFSTEGFLKSKKYYTDWKDANHILDISQEGHGVKAASELLYALENKTKKINFLDEPELHLYPATKYSLGKIISTYSARTKQILLVTHDAEMLRGLVYSSKNATVLRINSNHELSYVSASTIGKAYSSDILQGAFQDGVVIVEGIKDKYVYSNAFSEKHMSDDQAIQVVSMYGKGSLSVPIPFYESLKIKNAVIADFDIIFPENDKSTSRKHVIEILQNKGVATSQIHGIETTLDAIWNFLKGRASNTKGLNCPGLTTSEKNQIINLINSVKQYGLFIVPYGGLEDWTGKPHDTRPEVILAIYRSRSNSTYKALTDFLNEVINYIKA
ncbi:hypothetical protein EPN95_01740 [Patescibacteria group bacterium]|nr:MAG: hypothetical protein EPN95_01740 [Patescibacteria group bacterium]